jgi:hypothetical protein
MQNGNNKYKPFILDGDSNTEGNTVLRKSTIKRGGFVRHEKRGKLSGLTSPKQVTENQKRFDNPTKPKEPLNVKDFQRMLDLRRDIMNACIIGSALKIPLIRKEHSDLIGKITTFLVDFLDAEKLKSLLIKDQYRRKFTQERINSGKYYVGPIYNLDNRVSDVLEILNSDSEFFLKGEDDGKILTIGT